MAMHYLLEVTTVMLLYSMRAIEGYICFHSSPGNLVLCYSGESRRHGDDQTADTLLRLQDVHIYSAHNGQREPGTSQYHRAGQGPWSMIVGQVWAHIIRSGQELVNQVRLGFGTIRSG